MQEYGVDNEKKAYRHNGDNSENNRRYRREYLADESVGEALVNDKQYYKLVKMPYQMYVFVHYFFQQRI